MKSFKNLKQQLLSKNPLKHFKNVAKKNAATARPTRLHEVAGSNGSSPLAPIVPLTTVTTSASAGAGMVRSATFATDVIDAGAALSYSTTSFQPTYFAYYVGKTVISPDSNITGSASNCVGKIVQTAKRTNQAPRKVALQISVKGLRILDCVTSECLAETSIYRMTYFTVWEPKKSIFAFVYQNAKTKLFECHALDCKTKFNAKFILSASQLMFNLAFERYHRERSSVNRMKLLQEAQAFCSSENSDDETFSAYTGETCREQVRMQPGLCALQQILPNSSLILNNTLPTI